MQFIKNLTRMAMINIGYGGISISMEVVYTAIKPYWISLAACVSAETLCNIFIPMMLYELVNYQKPTTIYIFMAAMLVYWITSVAKDPMVDKLSIKVSNYYLETQLKRYVLHDADSRNKFESTEMYSTAREIGERISNLSAQCLWNGSRLIESCFSVIFMFWYRGYILIMILLIAVRIIWDWYMNRQQLIDCKIARDTARDQSVKLNRSITRLLPELQQHRFGVEKILKFTTQSNEVNYKGQLGFLKFWISTESLNKMIGIAVVYYLYITDNLADLILLYQLIYQFNFTLSIWTSTSLQIAKADTMMEKYEAKWKKLTPYIPVANLDFPLNGITFSSINVDRNGFKVKANNFSVIPGQTYVLTGESGSGKSTICNVIIGDIGGGTLSTGVNPACYRRCFAISYQSREFQDKDITLREIFGMTDDPSITYSEVINLIERAELAEWMYSLTENSDVQCEQQYDLYLDAAETISKSNLLMSVMSDLISFKIVPIKTKIAYKKVDPLDIKLNGLSGGQKTRIDLIRTVLRAKDPKIAVVVMDEPESGIDQKQGMRVLKKMLSSPQLVNKAKIIVTHMCECRLKELPCDVLLNIKNGLMFAECSV